MRTILLIVPVIITLTGCSSSGKTGKEPVRLLAATSTKEAVQDLAALFEKENNVKVQVMAEASSKLATQIVEDAPADLFLSASEKWADHVKEKGYAAETKPLLTNNLVLVTPEDNPAGVAKPEDLIESKVKKIAMAGPKVPAGDYGRQALKHLKLLEPLEKAGKIVSGENVRVALTYVERGEAEAGIVYDTDAKITPKVKMVYTFPAGSHEKILYPLVLLKAGEKKDSAKKFYEMLRSERGAEVFRKHGFTMVNN